ncbi:ParB-like nuclease domain protein [mine drainage metagenome]|uniref:ParB-like nuclease domain protein n=1 Tax=mine drainage metagenome TaxID=410659 RepID=A0A1J5PWW3_9ZZZZ
MEIRQIPLERLELDTRNPRIGPLVASLETAPNSEWVVMALGRYSSDDEEKSTATSYSSLKESIKASGGIVQPIIAAPIAGTDRFVVIEGNTRVAIYKELAGESDDAIWLTVPTIVRDESDEKGEHAIRLQAHLVGPRPWRPYAKAKYLHDLYHDEKLSLTEIHAICGGTGRRREIEEYIEAYADMQRHYVGLLNGAPLDQSRFSAFVELQKPPVLAALTAHGFSKTDFAKWVNDDRLSPLQTVRQLPRILAHSQARQRFLSRNAGEALKVLEQPASTEVIRDASVEQLAAALAVKMRSLTWPEANAILQDRESRLTQAIVDCYFELRSICKQLDLDENE